MKTRHFLIRILFTFMLNYPAGHSFSQGFYITAGGGYDFNIQNAEDINLCSNLFTYGNGNLRSPMFSFLGAFAFNGYNRTFSETTTLNGTTYTYTSVALDKGFGGGANFSISAGYAISHTISVEIEYNYLPGTSILETDAYTNSSSIPFYMSTDNYAIGSQIQSSGRSRVIPLIKINVFPAKFSLYLKGGPLFGFGGNVSVSNTYVETETNGTPSATISTINDGITASGGISLGYRGALGAEYSLKDYISIWLEVNKTDETWLPVTGNITGFTESNNPGIILSSTQFTYSENVIQSGNNTNANNVLNVSSQYPQPKINYDSWGITLGVKIKLSRKKPATPVQSIPKH